MEPVSTKKTNTMATNVTSTASINCHCKKVTDCYILHTVLFAIIQNENVQYQMESNEFKKVRIKNRSCYYFDDII